MSSVISNCVLSIRVKWPTIREMPTKALLSATEQADDTRTDYDYPGVSFANRTTDDWNTACEVGTVGLNTQARELLTSRPCMPAEVGDEGGDENDLIDVTLRIGNEWRDANDRYIVPERLEKVDDRLFVTEWEPVHRLTKLGTSALVLPNNSLSPT